MLAILPLLAMLHAHACTINVFAAASLKESFATIGRMFEARHPGVQVQLNFAGSQTLAAQINAGAPADVFASADERNLNLVQHGTAKMFARNRLVIVVRKGLNGLRSAEQLTNAEKLVVADNAVPAGKYALEFMAKGAKRFGTGWLRSIQGHIVSREQDVRAVLAKVRLGEADAGIVYVSDAASGRGDVRIVNIPDALNVMAQYPAAVVDSAANRTGGEEFVSFLLSPAAQGILKNAGFISIRR